MKKLYLILIVALSLVLVSCKDKTEYFYNDVYFRGISEGEIARGMITTSPTTPYFLEYPFEINAIFYNIDEFKCFTSYELGKFTVLKAVHHSNEHKDTKFDIKFDAKNHALYLKYDHFALIATG